MTELSPAELLAKLAASRKKITWAQLRRALTLLPVSMIVVGMGGLASVFVGGMKIQSHLAGDGTSEASFTRVEGIRPRPPTIARPELWEPWLRTLIVDLENSCRDHAAGPKDCLVVTMRTENLPANSEGFTVLLSTFPEISLAGYFFQRREGLMARLPYKKESTSKIRVSAPRTSEQASLLFVARLLAPRKGLLPVPDRHADLSQFLKLEVQQ